MEQREREEEELRGGKVKKRKHHRRRRIKELDADDMDLLGENVSSMI